MDIRSVWQKLTLSKFSPTFAFGWTFLCGLALGSIFMIVPSKINLSEANPLLVILVILSLNKTLAVSLLMTMGSLPWIPLILENIAEKFSREIFWGNAVHREEYSRANKLLAERRRWEAVDEFKSILREKPDDPEVLFQLAEVYLLHLGDVQEGFRRYTALWKRVQTPDQNALWVNRFPVERALSIAVRLADIHYLSRNFPAARSILEELLAIRAGDLGDRKRMVLDRIDLLKPLKDVRPSVLVLFDVDGTLCHTGGAGGKAVAAAFEDVYGMPVDLAKIDFRGRTDISLWREILSIHGRSYSADDPYLEAFKGKYIDHLRRMLYKSDPKSTLGSHVLLERLEREPSVALGLLTGNIEPGGRTKIQAVDLNRFFPVGGFGEDGEDRADIGAAAILRAESFYRVTFPRDRVFVVGDAAADVETAKRLGAKSIAVGTGWTSKEELMGVAPDLFLEDFRHPTVFLNAIGIQEPAGHRLSAIEGSA